jgi:hypothetical protein
MAYGCSVKTTFGLITDDVAVMISRCFPVRYSADVTATTSAAGLTVTVVNSGADDTPALFVATMVKDSVTPGAPIARVWVKVALAALGGCWSTWRGAVFGAGPPVWVTLKVRVRPPGSAPVMFIVTGVPDNTVWGATWLTIGESTTTGTLTLALADPAELVTVTVKLRVVAPDAGAVKVAVAELAFVRTTGTVSVAD